MVAMSSCVTLTVKHGGVLKNNQEDNYLVSDNGVCKTAQGRTGLLKAFYPVFTKHATYWL